MDTLITYIVFLLFTIIILDIEISHMEIKWENMSFYQDNDLLQLRIWYFLVIKYFEKVNHFKFRIVIILHKKNSIWSECLKILQSKTKKNMIIKRRYLQMFNKFLKNDLLILIKKCFEILISVINFQFLIHGYYPKLQNYKTNYH